MMSLSVFFSHDISKTDTPRITKHYIEMFHHESWKPIYFRVKRSRLRGTETCLSCVRRNAILTFAACLMVAACICYAGFSLHHCHMADAVDHRFFCAWSFFAVSLRHRMSWRSSLD